jgi:hypothetical protein
LVSDVRGRPKNFVREFQIAKVIRLVKIDPRRARLVKGKNVPSVLIPIIIIWFWSTKTINNVVQRIGKNYLGLPSFLQPDNRTQDLIGPTSFQIFIFPNPSQRKSFFGN